MKNEALDFSEDRCKFWICSKWTRRRSFETAHHNIQRRCKTRACLLLLHSDKIITCYCHQNNVESSKCVHVCDIRLVFINLESQDIVTWNMIIAAYAEHGKY